MGYGMDNGGEAAQISGMFLSLLKPMPPT